MSVDTQSSPIMEKSQQQHHSPAVVVGDRSRRNCASTASRRISDYFGVVKKRALSDVDAPNGEGTSGSRKRRAGGQHHPQTPMGAFGEVPIEMFFTFCDSVSLDVLRRLGVCSGALQKTIYDYTMSGSARRRFRSECGKAVMVSGRICVVCRLVHDHALPSDHFRRWGSLLKALTCLDNTPQRIEKVLKFFQLHHDSEISYKECRPEILSGWGILMMKFMNLWEFRECEKLFDALMAHGGNLLGNFIDKGLLPSAGTDLVLEGQLRMVCRSVFLDVHMAASDDRRDYPFWLQMLFKGRCHCKHAQLLHILYAPLLPQATHGQPMIDWRSLCDRPVTTYQDACQRIRQFGVAVDAIARVSDPTFSPAIDKRYRWTTTRLFALVEELTTCPEPWALDNFAALLLMAPNMAVEVLRSRININDAVDEVAAIVGSMKTLWWRWHRTDIVLSAVLERVVMSLTNVALKRRLLLALVEAHRLRVSELLVDPLPAVHNELNEEFQSYQQFTSILRHLRNLF